MKLLFSLFLHFFLVVGAYAQTTVEIFTEGPESIVHLPGLSATHYDLSMPEQVKRHLLPQLPPDKAKALAIMKNYMGSEAGVQFSKEMKAALKGKQLMHKYLVMKLPAIVFNEGESVIYGTTDLRQAMVIYHADEIAQEANNAP